MTGDLGRRSAELSLTVRSALTGALVIAAGEVDMATADDLGAAISSVLNGPGSTVTVDLAGVTFLDSQGIFVLMRAYQTAAEQGRTLTVTNCRRSVRRVLEITGVLKMLTAD
jgi:anti-anti-sigma factor